MTRTETTTIDGQGNKVTEVTEATDDGRGHRTQNRYIMGADDNKPKQAIKSQKSNKRR